MEENNNVVDEQQDFIFNKANYKLLIIGIVVVILGFILMSGGASDDPNVFTGGTNEEPGPLFSFRRITLAPILVIGGYVVVLLSILKKTETK